MAVKIALVVGLFIVICVAPGLKSSQVVPEGLVYTEVQKTVVRGVEAVLTCRFYGDPLTVYWRKGLDPDDLSLMVAWNGGRVSGPRFDDGSCDVDENYSLIIKNVSTADVGRIYCTVSNNKGPTMTNYTDIVVLDTAITTNPQATLKLRQATYGILPCTVHIKARRVSWKKGTTSSGNESLVVIENNQGSAERSGAGYEEGTYNITHDYSLVIKELQIHHEGLYVCQVTDDTGISFRNQTFVNVFAQPLEPFPTIQECLNAEPHDSTYCTIVAKSGMTLTCQAVKYYPSINLVFLYGSKALEPSDTREWNNTDETKNKTITIPTGDNKELYTCVAFNTPGTKANKSTSVLLHDDEPVKSTLVIIIVCCSVFAAFILIPLVAYFIWRKKGFRYINVQQLNDSVVQQSGLPLEPEDFEVQEQTKKEFEELEQRVDQISMKHYLSLHEAFDTASFEAEQIIRENRTALFDTHRMLTDWQQRATSPISRYIGFNEHTDIVAEKSGPASDHDWPTNEELRSISRHLTQESMKDICKELQIAYSDGAAKDEGKRFDSLCEWRTKVSNEPLEEKHNQLSSVLESNDLGGLIPNLRGPYVYKAELVDLAFHLLMHDLLPIAKALGISVTKLASYRPAFHPSHLAIGTVKLLTELYASIGEEDKFKRSIFCSKITKLHYQDVARRGAFEYDMSYGELCSITEAIYQNAGRRADQGTTCTLPEELQDVQQLTGQDLADGLEPLGPLLAVAMLEIEKQKPRLSHDNYNEVLAWELRSIGRPGLADEIIRATTGTLPEKLQDVLQLTGQDLADGFDSSHPLTAHAMLKIWKEKPRTSVFNYRAALAHELRINEMPDLADKIIGGTYITERTSLAFIRHLVQGLNQDKTRSLGELLQLSRKKEQWHTTTPFNTVANQIYVWVAGWTTDIKVPVLECSSMANPTTCMEEPGISAASAKPRAEEHRDLNDKLVEHGFLDLAREIMIIEQQQLDYGL